MLCLRIVSEEAKRSLIFVSTITRNELKVEVKSE